MSRIPVLAILFVIVCISAMLAGCTSGNPTGGAATPSPVPSATQATSTTTPTPPAVGTTVPVTLTSQNIAFDKNTISVPAGSTVVMTFVNNDAGVPHNFALYTDSSASQKLFAGDFVTGVKTVTYTFTAPSKPGNYFFRCDVHPTVMYGTFVVT
jgi:plastocyanin